MNRQLLTSCIMYKSNTAAQLFETLGLQEIIEKKHPMVTDDKIRIYCAISKY